MTNCIVNRIEYESYILEYGDDYIIYKSNNKYEGSILKNENGDDQRHGYGLMTYSDGQVYQGDFKNDVKDGKGRYISTEGFIYEGEFKNNKNEGNLKIYDNNGKTVFDGTINEKGESTGFIMQKEKSEYEYEGYIVNNLKEGKGKITFANGNIYEGEFKDDLKNGNGKFTFANGNIYEGEFKDDMRHGKGTLYCKEIYDDGDVYEEIYEGYWENDMKNGMGETRIKGFWRNNAVISKNENIRYNRIVEEIKRKLEKNCRCSYYNSSEPYYQRMFPDDEVYTFY